MSNKVDVNSVFDESMFDEAERLCPARQYSPNELWNEYMDIIPDSQLVAIDR